ncbi:MAG: hypothetical protein IKR41_12235, partial [Bacteroidales bacterium]|nr:hypothetical protein [Bacteroidales bacterium]
PFRLPTKAEFENLANLANNTQFVTHNGMACKEFTNDYGSVFFPAAGGSGGRRAGDFGYCWSGESGSGGGAWGLGFRSGYADVGLGTDNSEFSVRLVRGL